MRKITITLVFIVFLVCACTLGKESTQQEDFTELIEYRADYFKTKFKYRLQFGDTATMALERDVFRVSASQDGELVIISVEIDHMHSK